MGRVRHSTGTWRDAVYVPPGLNSTLVLCMQFADWADRLGRVPTRDEAVQRWGMDRATAYRYLAAYKHARADRLTKQAQAALNRGLTEYRKRFPNGNWNSLTVAEKDSWARYAARLSSESTRTRG